MDYGFYCGDHHIHAAGCAHYTSPTEGVTAQDMLLRVKGELAILEDAPDAAAAAEGHFLRAPDDARLQGALSWELRATVGLARLWRDQHRAGEARETLRSVYRRFTEGIGTADLREAKSLPGTHPAASLVNVLFDGIAQREHSFSVLPDGRPTQGGAYVPRS